MKNNHYPKIIAVISFLMIIVLGVFAYLNYNREREFMIKHLTQEGMAISNLMETLAQQNGFANNKQFQFLFEASVKDTLIEQIILIDDSLKIIAHSERKKVGGKQKDIDIENIKSLKTEIIKSEGKNIFRLVKPFYIDNGYKNGKQQYSVPNSKAINGNKKSLAPYYIIISFNADEYILARKEDLIRALGTAILLLLLLITSFYFITVIQKYNALNRSLIKMKNYAFNIVESMPNGLISIDKNGAVQTINKNAVKLLGLVGKRIKGKLITDLLPSCDIWKSLVSGIEINNEQINCNLIDGSSIPLSMNSRSLINESGDVIGAVIIFKDIRDIKILEKKVERTQRLASMGRMAAGIAHEIRNPLSSIKGFAQYFRNKFKSKSDDWHYADVIVSEVDRLNRVIQDLLNFAKPLNMKIQKIEVENIIHHTLKLVEEDLKKKQIATSVEKAMYKGYVLGDEDQLIQMFLNLFINSIEASDIGGNISVDINQENEFLVIKIKDNGQGIKEEDIQKIFDPFFTQKKGGTGLGLAIVYRITENHNGEISVMSDVGVGTTFSIKLPKKAEPYEK